MMVPHVGTRNWITSLNLAITDSNWDPWYVNGEDAGYKTTYARDNYTLVFATVKEMVRGFGLLCDVTGANKNMEAILAQMEKQKYGDNTCSDGKGDWLVLSSSFPLAILHHLNTIFTP
ncbi:hypothetical protein L2E82_25053 [Cichorium intybus]|uniref:Uncharacterized protein n=1 Tax=Cichorium intybus TaxID=13427 RepID=A0ACB9E1Y2_CICIN|nr:hypothetical protein L2E82_25053 [Cichorium intybus]